MSITNDVALESAQWDLSFQEEELKRCIVELEKRLARVKFLQLENAVNMERNRRNNA